VNLGEAARTGAREIRANKFRSILSFSAISVGVASLLFTLNQGRSIRESTERAIEYMGPGRIEVEPKSNYQSKGISQGLTYQDYLALRDQLPDLFMIYPKARAWSMPVVIDGKEYNLRVDQVSPEWRRRDWAYDVRGRFINEWDMAHGERVCVAVEPAGWFKKPFWAKFWGGRDSEWDQFASHSELLGRTAWYQGKALKIVGVLVPPPRDLDPRWNVWDQPNIIVPYTAVPPPEGLNKVGSIILDSGSEATVGRTKRKVEQILNARHREPDFEVKDMREEIEGEMEEARKALIAFGTLGAVALFAGGIGIMNVTFATVFSRFKEIGIRRALGAERSDILLQFVLEALFLGLAGGVAGVVLGKWGIVTMAEKLSRDASTSLSWLHVAEALATAAAISAGFAFYPAWQASKLDPVDALRSE
jgi:putative ABC transport system permease protein